MIDLRNRLEPYLGEIGSICTKTGLNDEDRTTSDTIYRQDAIDKMLYSADIIALRELPSAQPTYTDEEIQKMQDLESAMIEKAYQLGYEEGKKETQPERTVYIPDTKAVRSKRDCVDLAERVVATFYDQEHEEWTQKTVTIADVLDSVCDEYTILPSAQPDDRLKKITDLVDGTIDHFDRDDAMDLLYQIKEVLK